MSQMKPEKATVWEKVEIFINTANQGLIAITTFYLMWYCYQSGSMWSKISQHAWITALGYQLLMAEGIMTYYKANSLTSSFTRKEKNHIHWILQAVGGAMALYGCFIYIIERERLGRRHFHGNHALWGLYSMILVTISMVSGLSALFSFELKKIFKPIISKFAHNFISLSAFISGMVSLIYIWKDGGWAIRNDPGNLRYMSAWCLGFITFFTCIGAFKSLSFQCIGIFKIFKCKSNNTDVEVNKTENTKAVEN
ncbi:hypothetical protein PVAND_006646 [Polypedilum vanderplanki]|uniref:ascorbate ferrireductase (transmembrane) n=1 Tax=Polypedilum vanderplanki TaxID=319348 RepID=A0A9J6C4B1_POLVA|nr:hypothetical protein PVAND_006646 [Polypedilum vanderplanki]